MSRIFKFVEAHQNELVVSYCNQKREDLSVTDLLILADAAGTKDAVDRIIDDYQLRHSELTFTELEILAGVLGKDQRDAFYKRRVSTHSLNIGFDDFIAFAAAMSTKEGSTEIISGMPEKLAKQLTPKQIATSIGYIHDNKALQKFLKRTLVKPQALLSAEDVDTILTAVKKYDGTVDIVLP